MRIRQPPLPVLISREAELSRFIVCSESFFMVMWSTTSRTHRIVLPKAGAVRQWKHNTPQKENKQDLDRKRIAAYDSPAHDVTRSSALEHFAVCCCLKCKWAKPNNVTGLNKNRNF